ncbi:hypothetical protein G7Y89_g15570 [Cudoniella acicularis]|uniref:DUF7082 domain-containing protein n=1 Tax=Cudoniella acicularis TaxID=354080 RepID=A0A8H4QKK9_9HELO|nr:hypothetical protein G7Y89_g15570 [Cudoniella acicularis]
MAQEGHFAQENSRILVQTDQTGVTACCEYCLSVSALHLPLPLVALQSSICLRSPTSSTISHVNNSTTAATSRTAVSPPRKLADETPAHDASPPLPLMPIAAAQHPAPVPAPAHPQNRIPENLHRTLASKRFRLSSVAANHRNQVANQPSLGAASFNHSLGVTKFRSSAISRQHELSGGPWFFGFRLSSSAVRCAFAQHDDWRLSARYAAPWTPPSHWRPIILDESYPSPESAALHEEGYEGALVARADSPKERLSMSAYGKPAAPQLHGYEAGRTYSEGSYPYATSSYGSQPPSSSTTPNFPHATQLTPMTFPSTHARPSYDDQSGPYLNVGSTPIPQVTSYSPQRGSSDTKIYVSITSLYELMTSNTPIFFLLFGHKKCEASLAKATQQGGVCQYTVSTEIPEFSATSWSSSEVPIEMFMESGDGDVIAKVSVGNFTYVSGAQSGDTTQDRKRKVSAESAELMKSPVKRTSAQLLRPKEEYGAYGYSAADATPQYAPTFIQPNHSSYPSVAPHQYNRSISSYPAQGLSRQIGYGYSSSSTASPPSLKAQSPQVGSWGGPYGSMVRSPGLTSNGGVPRLQSLPSPASAANPPLIRTSTIQNTPSPASTPHGGHPGSHFNAYALYPHKAKLEIQGDLDAMAQNWSEEEWDSKRRLVHFRRSQAGSTITTTFQPVSVDERPPNSVCISCIYWEEKQECFVTSVDTIYLLEQLVAARFTVEEKNRIRRNLEGFRPLTVSKGKSDSEEFFKVIMAFPTPKPRNIEKDVKVFHWKDLASALKKIIGKYVICEPIVNTAASTCASDTSQRNRLCHREFICRHVVRK